MITLVGWRGTPRDHIGIYIVVAKGSDILEPSRGATARGNFGDNDDDDDDDDIGPIHHSMDQGISPK